MDSALTVAKEPDTEEFEEDSEEISAAEEKTDSAVE